MTDQTVTQHLVAMFTSTDDLAAFISLAAMHSELPAPKVAVRDNDNAILFVDIPSVRELMNECQ
jgi:hypothetical protein